jgi:hypothetical protein
MNAVTAWLTSASTCAVNGDVRGSYPPSSKPFAVGKYPNQPLV